MATDGVTEDRPDWFVEPLEGGVRNGCLNCPDRPNMLPLEAMLGVGFGQCLVVKGDEVVWSEPYNDEGEEDLPRLARFETMALNDPDHDWRAIFDAPLWSGTWQRHGPGEWLLIERGEGFA